MAVTVEPAAPESLSERFRRTRGWRMALLLVSPYLAIQVFHQAAPGLFPDFLSKLGEFRFLPDWANEALLYLKEEEPVRAVQLQGPDPRGVGLVGGGPSS